MNPQVIREYINDTKLFFEKYLSLLEIRMSNANEDIEDTGLLTAWLSYVAKLNVERSLKKLEGFHKNIFIPPDIQEYSYFDLLNLIVGIPLKSNEKKHSAEEDPQLLPMICKTTEYLLRAKEMLELQLEELKDSSYFIPTEYMLLKSQTTQTVYAECLRVLSTYQKSIPVDISQKKSWLTRVLRLGISMVQIQRVAFGLLNEVNLFKSFREKGLNASKIQQNHKEEALETLKRIVQKLDTPAALCSPTSETKKVLGCQNAEDMPTSGVHYQYFRFPNIKAPLHELYILMSKQDNISAYEVLECTRSNRNHMAL